MKKIIALFLIAVLLFSNLGGVLLFKIQQQINYQHIKTELSKTKVLTTITLSLADYKESKVTEDEIKLRGKMYDVQQVVISNNSVTIYCLADEIEDKLIATYQNLEKKTPEETEANTQLLKFLSLIFLLEKQEVLTAPFTQFKENFLAYRNCFKTAVLSIESPPPKRV